MLKIRAEQVQAFEQANLVSLVSRIMVQVRSCYHDRVPDSDEELRESVTGWIADARAWGFSTDPEIIRYVDFCARTQGRREPLEVRLETYLRIYHENLLERVAVREFVQGVTQSASRHRIIEEEGIAWLAVILLTGRLSGDYDQSWMTPILDQPNLAEEFRLRQVHQQAVARGWIAS